MQAERAYLVWCIAYADIKVLYTFDGQRFFILAMNMVTSLTECSQNSPFKEKRERGSLQVNRSSQRHRARLPISSVQVFLIFWLIQTNNA